ncbi:MAG: pyruvate carboxylase subunit B [Cognaticolwellia sp.]|jgi:pyruvate carboxylase subunit B
MGRKIKLALVYRDMWQSSGKYVPTVDMLTKVAPHIVDMGCFARVETNGGGFEQVNLLFGENPNKAVREWTQPFNDAGIQTQMLERALNGIRMSPVAVDVRKLMFKVKKKQGTDISRSFCGLNDYRNIADSIKYAKEGGMIAQAALSITVSEVHTVEYYVNLAKKLIDAGADEICIKDMAGIGRPVSIGKMVKGIKDYAPDITIQYHGHTTPGFSIVSTLEAVRNGADIIDVGMEPLSWGTGHADLLTVHEMLRDAGYDVPDINMDAYMKVRALTQEFVDDFLGYYINQKNRFMNSLLIAPGLPGGMMGSLMADLENNLKSLNKWLTKRDKPTVTQDDLLIKLFDEVAYARTQLGYPPLVTPYSQYVKNVSLINAMNSFKDKPRWSIIDDNTWDMLLGRAGNLPGKLGDDILAIAKKQGREFYNGHPQELYPDVLDEYRQKMKEKGWDTGEDEEELLEYAMHENQYLAYKSGEAKKAFEKDLAARKAKKDGVSAPAAAPKVAADSAADFQPKKMNITVNGERFVVNVAYDDNEDEAGTETNVKKKKETPKPIVTGNLQEVIAPLEGKFYLTKDSSETSIQIGDNIIVGQTIAYIEAMKVINAITSDKAGKVVEICYKDGQDIEEDEVIVKLQ